MTITILDDTLVGDGPEVGEEYMTSDSRMAEVSKTVLGPDNCCYFIGYIEDWPKPVVWDERGKDIYGDVNLVLNPEPLASASISTYWLIRKIGSSEVEKVCYSEEEAFKWLEGMELFYDIVKFEEVK